MAIAGVIFLHEHITKTEWQGTFLALIGTLVIVFAPLIKNGLVTHGSSFLGNLLILGSVFVGVWSAIIIKRLLRQGVDPWSINNSKFIIGYLLLLPFTFLVYPTDQVITTLATIPLSVHLGVWFFALVVGTLAHTIEYKGVKTIEIGEASIFTYLNPIWAAPLAIFWLGEQLTWPLIVGSMIIYSELS